MALMANRHAAWGGIFFETCRVINKILIVLAFQRKKSQPVERLAFLFDMLESD